MTQASRTSVSDCLGRTGELAAVSDSPGLDLELLLTQVLAKPRAWLLAHGEATLPPARLATFHRLLERRRSGEPIAYILGRQEFWSLSFEVNAQVLVPRPETELLVEAALARCTGSTRRIADLGTGSGAIVAALARETGADRRLSFLGTDISGAAVRLARKNLRELDCMERVQLLQADWGAPLGAGSLDLLVCNPPYVAADDPQLPALAHEPVAALVAARAGRAELEKVALQAARLLTDGGWLLLEHGAAQGDWLHERLRRLDYREMETLEDLAGLPRVTLGRRRGGGAGHA